MKIIRFKTSTNAKIEFGAVIKERAVPFTALAKEMKEDVGELIDSRQYLAGLPGTEVRAKSLVAWGEENLEGLDENECPPLSAVQLETPIEVTALFDLGLTPRHLKNSLSTLLKYEKDNPQTTFLLEMMAQVAFQDKPKPPEGQPEQLAHYKSNMNSIVGDGTVVPWPDYTQYLDIEPELAVVYGNAEQPVAGYCIFNDVSARDVQATELVGGFCLSKDVANGNQIGPYLVTTDEAGDVFDQTVKVEVNGALRFEGSTSEISHKADAVFAWLGYITPLRSGSVMGFGTVPDCTGLDQGDFLKPGDDIVITFDRLGSLRSKLGKPAEKLLPSRWTARPELGGFRKD